MSDHGLFFSYESQQGAVNRQDSLGVSQGYIYGALDDWVLACAPTSPAQSFRHHGPRYFNFPYFCLTTCGLEKLGLVDKK